MILATPLKVINANDIRIILCMIANSTSLFSSASFSEAFVSIELTIKLDKVSITVEIRLSAKKPTEYSNAVLYCPSRIKNRLESAAS